MAKLYFHYASMNAGKVDDAVVAMCRRHFMQKRREAAKALADA